MPLVELSLAVGWKWRGGAAERTNYLGRDCIRLPGGAPVLLPYPRLTMADGVLEMDVAVTAGRSFPGLAWRVRGDTYESFYVRPHQVVNPDSIQYTPVFNAQSAWQLYHGPGYWATVNFPLEGWFTLRTCFAGSRGEAYVVDMEHPALAFGGLKVPARDGGIGILPGGLDLHIARLAYDPAPPTLRGRAPRTKVERGRVPTWLVSDAFREVEIPRSSLTAAMLAARAWTPLKAEPTGLVNLARLNGITDGRNTVFARTTITATTAGTRAMDLGFSDRAVVFLNGRPLFAGDDTYRSRDYRFLGSIGYHDTIYLPLDRGANDLVVGVAESFGGWGIQARFQDPSGITFA